MGCVTSVSEVDLGILDNVFWTDSFVFGTAGDTTWSFNDKHFLSDVKRRITDTEPLLQLTSAGGTLVVGDPVQRILSFYVSDVAIRAALPPGRYRYDLIMVDNST